MLPGAAPPTFTTLSGWTSRACKRSQDAAERFAPSVTPTGCRLGRGLGRHAGAAGSTTQQVSPGRLTPEQQPMEAETDPGILSTPPPDQNEEVGLTGGVAPGNKAAGKRLRLCLYNLLLRGGRFSATSRATESISKDALF